MGIIAGVRICFKKKPEFMDLKNFFYRVKSY